MQTIRNLKRAAGLLLLALCATATHLSLAQSGDRPPLYDAIDHKNLAKAQDAIRQGADVNAIYARDTMLCWAIRSRSPEIVQLLLQTPRIDVNKRGVDESFDSEWERTPLILAAHMDQAEVVSQLLRMGAKVNARDRVNNAPEARGDTALLKAAQRDNAASIKALVLEGKGIDLNVQTKLGEPASWFLAEAEDLPSLKLLREHGARILATNASGASVLTQCVRHKRREVFDYLISSGADINQTDNAGQTTLMTAINQIKNDRAKTVLGFVQYLLALHPKLDLQQIKANGGGESALHLAARQGLTEMVALLLDQGATLDLKSLDRGGTALHDVAVANHMDTARLLLSRRASLEILDQGGATPLLQAVRFLHPEMVELLVNAGAAVNIREQGNALSTPLVEAAGSPDPTRNKESLAILKFLLSHRADIDFASANGRTALMAAAQQSNPALGYERAALLISKGAKLDQSNDRGETALMLASGAGNEKLVKLLLDKGADATKKNGAGETVMSYANRAANKGGAALLASRGVPPEQPIVRKSVVVGELVGLWTGFQDGMPQALYTITLNKNGSYDFHSNLTPEALKMLPKGAVKSTIAANHGSYTFDGDTMIWTPVGAPPTSMKWRLEKGVLILDNKIRLKKAR